MDEKSLRQFGLIGRPLGHSFSEQFFNTKFQSEQINAQYRNFELPDIDELPKLLRTHPSLEGLNVTIPYKEQVLKYLDEIAPSAAEIGAVNVLKITRGSDGKFKLKGYNTDVIGFVDSIRPLLLSHHKNAIILGTGGASKAVAYGLKHLGIETILFVSRRTIHDEHFIQYDDLTPEILHRHKITVNATPLGMYPNTTMYPPIPYDGISDQHICYDLIYNPEYTAFMRKCDEKHAKVKNGLEMLHRQALAAWDIWNEK